MGELDMAALQADFDQEDDERLAEALRFATDSAMRTSFADESMPVPESLSAAIQGSVGVGGEGLNGDVGGGGGGAEEWDTLTLAALKRKTVAELKGFLQERGVPAKGKPKKAELVEKVSELLQVA